jgi:hypothetical protein
MKVQPDGYFENETIRCRFIPRFASDLTEEGEHYYLTFILENDGSIQDQEETPGFEFLAPIVALGIAFLLFRRKEKRS